MPQEVSQETSLNFIVDSEHVANLYVTWLRKAFLPIEQQGLFVCF